MNTSSIRTRHRAAILFSGALVLGGLAIATEATAGEEVGGNPTCSSLGYEYTYKVESPGEGSYAVDRDGMDATLRVGTYADVENPNSNNAVVSYSISTTATGYAVVVKGGNGATVYRSGPGGLESPPLHAPAVASDKWPTISHFDLCWNGPPEPGRLDVTKVVAGTDTPDDHTFEICVTPTGDGDRVCKTIVGDGTLSFPDLRPGTYIITETDPGPRFSVEGSGVTVTVRPGETTTATVTNTWKPPNDRFGRVEVTKIVTGDAVPTTDVYEICVVGPDESTTKTCATVVGAGTVAFENLVPGTYAVVETDPGTEYDVTITPTTVEVQRGKTATATVTNEYVEQESLPPTVPTIPTPPTVPNVPTAPTAPVAPVGDAGVASQSLPATGSEGGLAAVAMMLVASGAGLAWCSRRRYPEEV